ncbi:MAG: hypothetical protein CSB46_10865, partial [Micrococcales bacterium]
LGQLARFALVGASGVVVNNAVLVLCNVIGRDGFSISASDVLIDLPVTDFNVRHYHAYAMMAFLVASMSNFIANRYWTFSSTFRAHFFKEYWPFLSVGLAAQVIGLGLLTLLMHPHSPIGLPDSIFDGSSGFRTKLYWANLIVIAFTTPINFVFNKLWTFRWVRNRHGRDRSGRGPGSVLR